MKIRKNRIRNWFRKAADKKLNIIFTNHSELNPELLEKNFICSEKGCLNEFDDEKLVIAIGDFDSVSAEDRKNLITDIPRNKMIFKSTNNEKTDFEDTIIQATLKDFTNFDIYIRKNEINPDHLINQLAVISKYDPDEARIHYLGKFIIGYFKNTTIKPEIFAEYNNIGFFSFVRNKVVSHSNLKWPISNLKTNYNFANLNRNKAASLTEPISVRSRRKMFYILTK